LRQVSTRKATQRRITSLILNELFAYRYPSRVWRKFLVTHELRFTGIGGSATFLEDGICSIVVTMEDGSTIEVGIIGNDGLVGLPAVLGAGHSPNRCFIQIPGSGYAVKAKILEEHSQDGSGQLRFALRRGAQALFAQTAQTAACNRVHELEERLARWLLMCHDRMQVDDLHITHEFLAMMLGTRRSSVTLAAGMLRKAGLIDHTRVRIENRKGLEEAACECYAVIHEEYVRLGLL
jgi:CRP-like cAMP-binding protein